MDIRKELVYKEFIQRENHFQRAPYPPELEFYSVIKSGDIKRIKELCKETLIDKKGLGVLSEDYVRNIKYHFVITTAMVARYCIEGGMEFATAYSLSDFYIQKADTLKTSIEVSNLHYAMCLDYTKRMQLLRKKTICSKPVASCLDYIYENLHTRITLETLANLVSLTPSYLSRLFLKEVGVPVSTYIQERKIETAKNMLVYSEYTPAQISNILAFSNQSYFTEIFHKKTGLTPKKYRDVYFKSMK